MSKSTIESEARNFYEKAIQSMQMRELKSAIEYFELSISVYPSSSTLFFKLAECFFLLKDYNNSYKNVKISIDKYEENLENGQYKDIFSQDPSFLLSILYLKLKIDEKISNCTEISYTVDFITKNIERFPNYNRIEEIQKEITRISQIYISKSSHRGKIIDSRKNEARQVYDLIELSNKDKLLTEEGLPVFIISNKWFKNWKKYSFFYNFSGEKLEAETNSNEIIEGVDSIEDMENEVDLKRSKHYPGPINNEDILSNEDIIMDPDKIKGYCNSLIKKGLEENKDFVIVSHIVFKYLHKIYGGKEVKRFIVNLNDDNNLTHVEIWLKKINFIQLLPIDNIKIESNYFYFSKKETIKYLKEKFIRINSHYCPNIDKKILDEKNCKIWKLESAYTLKDLKEMQQLNTGKQIQINAKKLLDSNSLEESEISDQDIILIEYLTGANYVFTSQKEQSENLKKQCSYCHLEKKKLYSCKCQTVKYCDIKCLRQHYQTHHPTCTPHIEDESDNITSLVLQRPEPISLKYSKNNNKGLTGLQNLGNTCFMNSSLQCLSNSYELTYYFLNDSYIKDINKKNPLGTRGSLASAFAELVKDLWLGNKDYISPWQLKKIIGKYCPQFSGYNQQDSQEVLSYMLDGLHEDLNLVKKKPHTEDIDYKNQSDENFSKESWLNYLKRNQSIIIDLFGGQYKSKLICPKCNKVSITFDPFLSISLPIPHISYIGLNMYFVFRNPQTIPNKMKLNLNQNDTCQNLIKKLSDLNGIKEEYILIVLIKEHKIIEYPNNNSTIKYLDDHEGIVFVYEVFNEEIDFPLKINDSSIQIELNIFYQLKKDKDLEKEVSYCRLIKVPFSINLEGLHIIIYKIFRVYLKSFFDTFENENKKEFFIDLDLKDEKLIIEEYRKIFGNKILPPPYKIYLNMDDRKKLEISSSSSDLLNSFFQANQQIKEILIEINLTFQNYIKIDILKLNKCQESNLNLQMSESKFCSIYQCLEMFSSEEILDKENAWYCSNCKAHKQATKKMEIYKAPELLILHLKRFKASRISSFGSYFYSSGTSKISKFVDFPVEGLDLKIFVKGNHNENVIYDLYAVSNHYGGLSGGHYTAFCKNYLSQNWFEFNDSSVSDIRKENVVSQAAYVLFYRRRKNSEKELEKL